VRHLRRQTPQPARSYDSALILPRERGGGVEDSDVELRSDDSALRSAFLGDFRIALKEDMMDRVQKAQGEVKDCATISHEQNICLCSNGRRQGLFIFHWLNNRRLAQRSLHENGRFAIRCGYGDRHSIHLISQATQPPVLLCHKCI
jgi:hypothetical protein